MPAQIRLLARQLSLSRLYNSSWPAALPAAEPVGSCDGGSETAAGSVGSSAGSAGSDGGAGSTCSSSCRGADVQDSDPCSLLMLVRSQPASASVDDWRLPAPSTHSVHESVPSDSVQPWQEPRYVPSGRLSAFAGGGSLQARWPALLVTVAASEQVVVSRLVWMRAPHGFSQCEQLSTVVSSNLQPRQEDW